MDEVLAVGDMAFQKKCLTRMREAAKKEGRTVLYVSHNMNTIRQLCDRCVVLDKGKVIYEGDVESSIRLYLGIDSTGNGMEKVKNLNHYEVISAAQSALWLITENGSIIGNGYAGYNGYSTMDDNEPTQTLE